jgi:RNA polymerase sigma-70 factor (ECF subfamily)
MHRHRRWVTRTLDSFTRNREEAEDLTQEAFTRMYRHAGSYRTRGGFVGWLRRITINTGNSYLQRREPHALVPFALLDDAPDHTTADPLLAVLAKSLQTEIRDAIGQLPEEQRDAILMHCFLGMTVPEIARRQQCPDGTVKSRVSNGLRRVRARLAETEEATE